MNTDVVLEVSHLDKRFGATHALRDASFSIKRGEVVALLGENGAGKSTLTKIISGEIAQDSGTIQVDNRILGFNSTADAISVGISRVPQEMQIFPALTVHENLFAGDMPRGAWPLGSAGVDRRRSRKKAAELLQNFGVTLPLDEPCAALTFAQKQLVMLLRALTQDVKVFILDEPTAALEQKEVQLLFSVVRGLAARGVAVIYITHRLSELSHIASRAVVMRDGRVVCELGDQEYDENRIGHLLSGDPVAIGEASTSRPARLAGGATFDMPLLGTPFSINEGEVLGFSGLLGSGVESMLISAFNRLDAHWRSRTGYVSGERGSQTFYEASILRNICAPHLHLFSGMGHFKERQARQLVVELIRSFDIRPTDPDRLMRELSGGNQQKVLLARWFVTHMDVLLLVEPTAGVDVGAKRLIQTIVEDYRRAGGTVLLSSTDYEELVSLCDRIVPVIKGAMGDPVERREGISTDEIRNALGGS